MQNSDAIDGVKFVGTLDGKTCPYCASYDGYIWRGEEIAEARRPPIHPNCRCCLIPYVELKDDEGNVVDVDGDRPAANADFDKLAQDAYNERAREKDWKRRWDDLSPSTRLKYYYQAQKDYEAETGKPAYRQVSGSTTFQEYFHRQPDSFKRAWLGAKRYELYKDGKLKEKNIFKPDLTYQVSAESLVRDGFRSIAQETIGKSPAKTKKEVGYQSIVANFDGISDVEVLRKKWKALTVNDKRELKSEIAKQRADWEKAIKGNKPNREKFATKADFDNADDLWRKDIADGRIFWESINEDMPELNIDVDEEVAKELPQTAEEFIDKIESARIAKYGEEEAKRLNEEAEKYAKEGNDFRRKEINLASEHEAFESRIKGLSFIFDPELYKKLKDELDKEVAEYNQKVRKYEIAKALYDLDLEYRENNRENVRFSLELLFPDKGGSSFFQQQFRDSFINLYDQRKCKELAEDVLELYDLVARSYNVNGISPNMPNVVFHKFKRKKGSKEKIIGNFSAINGDLRISQEITGNKLRSVTAHEFGHWLELWGIGYDRTSANTDWLISEQNAPKIRINQRKKYRVSNINQPTLCIRDDNYSQAVYPNQRVPGQKGKKYNCSEVISTAMEYLIIDPEMFARRCPKQFNLLLENFRELSGKTR